MNHATKSPVTSESTEGSDAIPLLDLNRQYAGIREEILAAIAKVCDSQSFVLGPEVEALEREIAVFTGAKFAVGCSSGTDALWLALVAAGVRSGDRVVTTPFSFFASASSIVRAGATPEFVDVDPSTLNLDASRVEKLLSAEGTRGKNGAGVIRAVLPVHLYGQCADMDGLRRAVSSLSGEGFSGEGFSGEGFSGAGTGDLQSQGIVIIEDAAQAIGAEWNGRSAGSLGIAAAFSFYPTKNLSAYGDAGIVTTSSPEMAEHMRRLRNHGSSKRYYHDEFGWNSRMDAIQAAVLRVKMSRISGWNDSRRQHASMYDRLLADAGLCASSPAAEPSQSPVRLVGRSSQAKHVFHQYVIRARRRDALRKFLAERKIGSEVYYPLPLHLQPAFAYLGLKPGSFPVAESAAQEVLALPMFPELTEAEIRRIVQTIAEFYS